MFGSDAVKSPDASPDDFGENNENLPKQIVETITEVIREAQQEDRWGRLQEVLRASLCRYYFKGIQHLWCDGSSWQMATPGQDYTNGDGEVDSFPDYIGDYNIFTAFEEIRQAKISEPDIGIDFQPIRPDKPADRQAAEAANAIRMQADIDRDPHEVMTEKIYYLDMDGTAIAYTYTSGDEDDFGSDDGPRRVICREVGGVLEWKRPIFADTRKDCWYLIRYKDRDIRIAKDKYPLIADELEAGQPCLSEEQYERMQRLSMVNSMQSRRYAWDSGDSAGHLITEGDIWLRPSAFVSKKKEYLNPSGGFEFVTLDGGSARPKTVGEKINEIFPGGGHFVYCGQSYAKSWTQPMDICISLCHVYTGSGQARKPGLYELVLVQDGFNQTINYIRENNDFGAPATWVNSQYCDYAAISKQPSRPGAYHELKNLPGGAKAADMIYRESPVGIPPGFLDFAAEFLMGALAQFMTACPPSVWGAPEADNKTAEGMRLAASQALGILGKTRTRIINSDAEDYRHACIAVSQDDEYGDTLTIPMSGSNGRTAIIKKAALTAGNFRAFPDKDSGFPESTGSKRMAYERFGAMVAPTPMAQEFYLSPKNMASYIRVYGLNLEMPSAKSWDKQSREIEELLRSRPILNDPGLVQMLAGGAGVQAMLDAIKDAIQKAQAMQLQAAQAAWNSPQNPAMVQHAAAAIAARATGQVETPVPPMPPPPPFDPFTIARSSVRVIDSDFHEHEAPACKDWLSGDECWAQKTIGRPTDDGGVSVNIAGVLNVELHWMEHVIKQPISAPPVSGPLPPVGSPPKPPPPPPGA